MDTTIVNTPPSNNNGGNVLGMIVGLVLVAGILLLVVFYGLPYLRQVGRSASEGTEVNLNVPDEVDVNVTTTSP